jgi:hypothetical protein
VNCHEENEHYEEASPLSSDKLKRRFLIPSEEEPEDELFIQMANHLRHQQEQKNVVEKELSQIRQEYIDLKERLQSPPISWKHSLLYGWCILSFFVILLLFLWR